LATLFAAGSARSQSGDTPKPDPTAPVSCSSKHCMISVDRESWPTECQFRCKPILPTAIIVEHVDINGDLVWSLPSDSNFNFADDGIEFPAGSGFKGCSVGDAHPTQGDEGPTTKKWVCKNNGQTGQWKYAAHIRFGLLTFRVDPWVVNR
jgi:hypothetical protein